MIKKPMKAPSKSITNEELSLLQYPVYGSPKLDGFRCLTFNAAYTSSMKLVRNAHIQSILSRPEYAGFDGELIVGNPNDPNAFNNTTGPVRRLDGEPDFKFYVFDGFGTKMIYSERYNSIKAFCNIKQLPFVEVVTQHELYSPEQVLSYEAWCVEQGYEGAMIRSKTAMYKEGRCTLKEMNIFKRKPTEDREGIILGFEEQMENCNEQTTNKMGNKVRSSNKENMRPKGTLGNFIVAGIDWKISFSVGCGCMTREQAQEIWNNKSKFLHKIITYKFQAHGSLDRPRQPIFKGFRAEEDVEPKLMMKLKCLTVKDV